MHKALPAFISFVYVTRNTADMTTFYINFVKPVFAKPAFNTLFCDFT